MYEAADEIATPDGPRFTDLAPLGSEADPVEGTEMAARSTGPARTKQPSDYSWEELSDFAVQGYDPDTNWRFAECSEDDRASLKRHARRNG